MEHSGQPLILYRCVYFLPTQSFWIEVANEFRDCIGSCSVLVRMLQLNLEMQDELVTSQPDPRVPDQENQEGQQAHYFGYIHLHPPRKHLLILTTDNRCDFVSDTEDWRYSRSGTHGNHDFENVWPLNRFTARFRYMGNDGDLLELTFTPDVWLSSNTRRPCFWGMRNGRKIAFCFGVCICTYFPVLRPVVRAEPEEANDVMAILRDNNSQRF